MMVVKSPVNERLQPAALDAIMKRGGCKRGALGALDSRAS